MREDKTRTLLNFLAYIAHFREKSRNAETPPFFASGFRG